ncbi:hypothetical protein PF008_g1899 [Phytophthora fragariae]|uniref:Uncharacterized protein n=1 Tax=Phytophthora fragariae TaxID=53985 RepID=A0A6G0SIP3_9STRA|nr:hypothetical protein PF008_g1899 [Phytophthora fragariae]
MAHSHSRSSSFSGSNGSSDRLVVPAAIRLQRAMEAHAALQPRAIQRPPGDSHGPNLHGTKPTVDEAQAAPEFATTPSASVEDLAVQLKNLWQREKDQQQTGSVDGSLPTIRAALAKIGSREKDELLLHLLEQQDALRTQRTEVAALGEKIAAQLLHQQHELRQKYREQIITLEEQLHEATHFNPKVAALQAKVDELEESNRDHEQKLRFAVRIKPSKSCRGRQSHSSDMTQVQKLQRSRKREKELKMMNDPLWD